MHQTTGRTVISRIRRPDTTVDLSHMILRSPHERTLGTSRCKTHRAFNDDQGRRVLSGADEGGACRVKRADVSPPSLTLDHRATRHAYGTSELFFGKEL